MEKYECGSGGVRIFLPDISLDNVVLLVYYCYYLKFGLCAVVYFCSSGLDWYLEQIKDI